MADIENNENVNNESNVAEATVAESVATEGKVQHKKNWLTTLILCWFLGFLGVHRMYAGKIGSGFLMLYCTIVAVCIIYLDLICGLIAFTVVGGFVVNDFLRIATKTFKDCYGNYIEEDNV